MIKQITNNKIIKSAMLLLFVILISGFAYAAGTVLSDSFTGTTIDTAKWVEIDSVLGGVSGDVKQNGALSIANSYDYTNSLWGVTGLYSKDRFASTSLEISAVVNPGPSSGPTIGYGDYILTENASSYLIYVAEGDNVYAYSFDNGAYNSFTTCGATVVGPATYKMKIISGGFEVYTNGVLQCTLNTTTVINNKPVFLNSSDATSTFDDLLVTGTVAPVSAPDASYIKSVSADNAQATVSFYLPFSTGGSDITSYTVTSNPGGVTATGTSSPIVVTGLSNQVSYNFTVTATNASGTSPSSPASISVMPALPDQVYDLVGTGFNKQALLAWRAPRSGVPTDYVVEYKKSGDSVWGTFNDGVSTSTKATLTGLENAVTYNFRVTPTFSLVLGSVSSSVSATPNNISTMAFVFTGESNSGGNGLNSDATPGELAVRSSVQIENLTSGLFQFEPLHIGVNNLRDHYLLESYYDNSHGFELQLANSVEENAFPDNSQVYLIKTGQGGSTVGYWAVGGDYWTKFLQRINAAKTQLPTDKQWVVWMSIGINDAHFGTDAAQWKTGMLDYINRIKTELPGAIIILTEFQAQNYPGLTYKTQMDELANEEPNVFVVDSTGAALRDGAHWSYAGLKTVGSRMVTITKNALGLNYPGLPTSLSATPGANSVDLQWTTPVSDGGSAISNYLVEYKKSGDTAWGIFDHATSTATSISITGLSADIYNFRVSSVNSFGAGNSVTTNATVSAPVVVQSSGGGGVLPITFTVPTKITKIDTASPTSTTVTAPIINIKSPTTEKLLRNLKRGMKGEDVKTLQQILESNYPDLFPKDSLTGYFGNITYKAVKQAQCKLGVICSGSESSTGWGLVGPRTREILFK